MTEVSVRTDVRDALDLGLRIVVNEAATTITIALAGEWDLAQQEATHRIVDDVLARTPERLVLDLRALSFIDSSGVRAVVQLANCAERLKIGLVIVPGPRAVHRVFEICQLVKRLPFISNP
jgi:anti-anti-sigma factor